jgi:hypothetical protein
MTDGPSRFLIKRPLGNFTRLRVLILQLNKRASHDARAFLDARGFGQALIRFPFNQPSACTDQKRAVDPYAAGWIQSRRLEARDIIPLRVGLRQQNLHKLDELLLSTSHPESPTYGEHFSAAQIIDTFAPLHKTIRAVRNWITDAGLSGDRFHLSASRGWITVNVTVEEAESLLRTEYHVYTHPSGAAQVGASDEKTSCTRGR